MRLVKACAATAAISLIAQPCLAAEPMHYSTGSGARPAAFAGVQVRVPLRYKSTTKASARLQLGSAYYTRAQSGALVQTGRSVGLELGAGKTGKPALYIGGQDSAEMKEKLNLDGTTTTLLIVGGVVLVVVALAAVASAMPTAGPREGAFD